MARGEDTSRHPNRRVGKPKATPFFELNDSPQQVARDWAQGGDTALGTFARSGEVSDRTFAEVDQNLNFGDIHPREKERLTNLRKHLQNRKQEQEESR